MKLNCNIQIYIKYHTQSTFITQIMIGIKSAASLLLLIVGLLLLMVPTTAIFPSPKFAKLSSTPHLLTSAQSPCLNLKLSISPDMPESFFPIPPPSLSSHLQPGQYYFNKILNRLYGSMHAQSCKKNVLPSFKLASAFPIKIHYDDNLENQGYKIRSAKTHIDLYVKKYQGYVYGLETIAQMIGKHGKGEEIGVKIGVVEDQPIVGYRGIMIDPVRHFIGVKYIRKLIQAMPLSKLNIIHWLFSNDEAFVLNLLKHPQLAQASRYSLSESYTYQQIRQLLTLSKLNAVSIVPEFDTPGHVRSWSQSKQWSQKNITILCPGGEHYNHQFDVSKEEVYQLASDVLKEGDALFRQSPYVHLGGDEVFGSCWDLRPAIKTFMALKNIKSYGELQMYWRYRLKQALPAGRKVIFWRNDADNVTTGDDDIVQYWGAQAQTANVTSKSNSKLILSPSDYLYLNKGTTWIWMNKTNGPFSTWRQIYVNFTVRPQGVDPARILGAEVCLWNQVQNQDTFQNQIWMRASAFAAKIWRNEVGSIADLVSNLVSLQKTLISMGIQPSPITNEYCQIYPKNCFPSEAVTTNSNVDFNADEEQIIEYIQSKILIQ